MKYVRTFEVESWLEAHEDLAEDLAELAAQETAPEWVDESRQ